MFTLYTAARIIASAQKGVHTPSQNPSMVDVLELVFITPLCVIPSFRARWIVLYQLLRNNW